MFVRKKEYERLVAEAASATERERLVQVLVEQIEYLRMQVGLATRTVTAATIATPDPRGVFTFDEAPVAEQPWVNEEEEDLLAMRQANVLTEDEFREAMARAKQRDHIIE